MLCSGRTVPDLSLASDPQGALQGMMRLALVQTETGAPLQVDIKQLVDHEQRPFDPSDLPQRDGQVMLARIGRELPQELARRHLRQGGQPRSVRPAAVQGPHRERAEVAAAGRTAYLRDDGDVPGNVRSAELAGPARIGAVGHLMSEICGTIRTRSLLRSG